MQNLSPRSNLPKLAVTMGDPAGIGPEIVVKAVADSRVTALCRPVVIGDVAVMRHAATEIAHSALAVRAISSPAEMDSADSPGGPTGSGVIPVLPPDGASLGEIALGAVSPAAGDAAFRCVKKAIELALAGEVDGTVTAPLNKEAMNKAGHHYDGHTEIYATLTGTKNYAMLLADGPLRVAHVTTHRALRDVSAALTRERILTVIRLTAGALRQLGITKPRIAVSGFNPHAGEGGLFGREEIDAIRPAVEAAASEGIDATGPFPPDSVFARAAGGGFDAVIAMYHDQGHIPLKMLSFKFDVASGKWGGMTGVNVTLGLPIIRTSVDHGTAFDNAGKNIASPESMVNAIEWAARLAAGGKQA